MAGIEQLTTTATKALLDGYWSGLGYELHTINQDSEGPLLSYFCLSDRLVCITSPISSNDFDKQLGRLEKEGLELENKHILAGKIGRGLAEDHILTVYCSPDGSRQIFDSKYSDMNRFHGQKTSFFAPVRALAKTLESRPDELGLELSAQSSTDYHALGTQSTFDGVSCGIHHVKIMTTAADLILIKQDINVEGLLEHLKNPVIEVSSILRHDHRFENMVDSSFIRFMKKAWFDTFMPLENDENKRQEASFLHYFLGWPGDKGLAHRFAYVLTLRFILKPISSLIKLPTQFLLNVLSETANFLRNQLIHWSPKNNAAQYIRSGLMVTTLAFQGLFKGLALFIRSILSPIDSYKAAKKHKYGRFFAPLSLAVSVFSYAVLALVLAPIALTALLAKGVLLVLSSAIHFLATPLTALLGKFSVAVAPEIVSLATVMIGSALISGAVFAVSSMVKKLKQALRKQNVSDDFFDFEDRFVSQVSPALSRLGGRRWSSSFSSSDEQLSEASSTLNSRADSLIWTRESKNPESFDSSENSFSFP